MFLNLAILYEGEPQGQHTVLTLPAIQLSRWLDEIWAEVGLPSQLNDPDGLLLGRARDFLRHPSGVAAGAAHGIEPSGLDEGLPSGPPAPFTLTRGPVDRPDPTNPANPRIPLFWDHLMYGYLIEATGAFDVVAEVGRRLVCGESLGRLSPESIAWLRNTEELLFRDPPLFSIGGIVSEWRPSAATSRRNAYWRMFGMDLPHQVPAGWRQSAPPESWKLHAGPGVNTDFTEKLTELFRQVWLGLENANNQIGANAADPQYIALLCQALGDMLRDRRQGGILAREEFAYVTMMSWVDLTLQSNLAAPTVTVEPDAPIIRDLQARGAAPEQRLNALAQKVGMKPAPRARELFQLARPLSQFLRQIENRDYDAATPAETLFRPTSALTDEMRRIINLWQSATGQRIKDRPIGTGAGVPGSAQPLRTPTPTGAPASSNGSRR